MTLPNDLPPLTARHALFLDFDGTLTPIQDDPDTVALIDPLETVLPELIEKFDGALAVISGRDVRDLSDRVPDSIWRIGGHGLDVCAPGEMPEPEGKPAPAGLEDFVRDAIAPHVGARLEPKGRVMAIHYREIPDARDALLEALAPLAQQFPGYSLQAGKMVIETKPSDANKGAAIRKIMETAPFKGRIPVMAGDDVTDEDGFAAVMEAGGFAIKVGDGETLAEYRISDVDGIAAWLEALNSK